MDIGPLLSGRIPSSLKGQRLTAELQANTAALAKLQDQISSGKQFSLPGQDPLGALQAIGLQQVLNRQTQSLANVQTDQSLLQATGNALSTVSTSLNSAKSILLQGIGSLTSDTQKQALATQVGSLITQVLGAANTQAQGRSLFAGTATGTPFTQQADGTVVYNGNTQAVQSLIDFNTPFTNNVDGNTAFGALSPPIGSNLQPALTLTTRLSDLRGGQGIPQGAVTVTIDDGVAPQTATVDLSRAQTIADVKTALEGAFGGGPLTLDVGIDPSNPGALLLTPSSGTLTVSDANGGGTAAALGIQQTSAGPIYGSNQAPRLTLQTNLSALNNGAGIAATPGQGLQITNGGKTAAIDVSSATTVQDLFNLIQGANLNLNLGINSAGNGLAISSKVSGTDLSISENGDTTATDLGIRTLTGSTPLASLNHGQGVPVSDGIPLSITRRDGTVASVDISTAKTVQDVISALNAVDPGNLVASLKTVGNGIQLTDNSGSGPLSVDATNSATALGIAGSETGSDPTVALVGSDSNPSEVSGTFNILIRLQAALNKGDDRELQRLGTLLDAEQNRVTVQQGTIGANLQLLNNTSTRLQTEQEQTKETLANVSETDITTALTQFSLLQTTFQATLKVASQTLQLSLYQYL